MKKGSKLTPEYLFNNHLNLEFSKGHPILDSIADGVFTVDIDKRITSFNRAAESITGYSREEAVGRKCSEVFQANICSQCALQQTIDTGEELVNIPAQVQNKRGEQVQISISTAVLRTREGQHIGGVETFRDLTDLMELRRQIDAGDRLGDIIGRHPRMQEILDLLPDVATSSASVLIQGPSGSGKGLLAKVIHDLSGRRDKPLIKVNCAALPETLLESELFGYVRGAFTDARHNKPGRVALAEGGTLFLDEVGDISPTVQVKLLRLVQEREYEPLGGTSTRVADVRLISATNHDLDQLIEQGVFRKDLFYRLNVVGLQVPSLTERREDIPRLVNLFLRRLNAKMGKSVSAVSEEAMELLLNHDYPGNVRELENAIEHALVLCRGSVIEPRQLPAALRKVRPVHQADPLQNAEAQVIKTALERYNGNRVMAARALGLHRTTLWRRMRRLGLA